VVGSASQADEDAVTGLICALRWHRSAVFADASRRRVSRMRRQALRLHVAQIATFARCSGRLRT
jgi:hypothetical protein